MNSPQHASPNLKRSVAAHSLLTDMDVYLFNEGTHLDLYKKLGAHPVPSNDQTGTYFAVWAPNANRVTVMGDFNDWDKSSHPLTLRHQSGIWEGVIPEAKKGTVYKYHIHSQFGNYQVDKADPFGFSHEMPPKTASVVWDLEYEWNDDAWMNGRADRDRIESPISIYELHLGSWRRTAEGEFLNYRDIARQLVDYVRHMGYTHVEFMPVMEHPFYGSWGYQGTGYFAPTSRYGTPQDLMSLIDYLHQNDIGVILDWVPSHFPNDEHGLGYFDGTHLFEHSDPRQGIHPDWNSYIFNYGRNEVRSFLFSNAMYWLKEYHVDALRVDAVASMLYLDYSRRPGEWIPNRHGGRENLDAIDFLRKFNEEMFGHNEGIQTIAEESTAWPMVSRPTHVGGLGFGMKWDMGWMHDTLSYMTHDPIHRHYHHHQITFRMVYAFHENFVLPLSHDEVVHGKGSLLGKMPGDDWQKFANLRLLFGYMYGQPGKKLTFMGGEFGQWSEWAHDRSLDWHLLENAPHSGLQAWMRTLNHTYRDEPALHEQDCVPSGFEWIDCNDVDRSVLSFLRKGSDSNDAIAVICNFTPVPRYNYHVGVPYSGVWKELLNSDAAEYGGSGHGNFGVAETVPLPVHGRPYCLTLTLPPLSALFFKYEAPVQ